MAQIIMLIVSIALVGSGMFLAEYKRSKDITVMIGIAVGAVGGVSAVWFGIQVFTLSAVGALL